MHGQRGRSRLWSTESYRLAELMQSVHRCTPIHIWTVSIWRDLETTTVRRLVRSGWKSRLYACTTLAHELLLMRRQ